MVDVCCAEWIVSNVLLLLIPWNIVLLFRSRRRELWEKFSGAQFNMFENIQHFPVIFFMPLSSAPGWWKGKMSMEEWQGVRMKSIYERFLHWLFGRQWISQFPPNQTKPSGRIMNFGEWRSSNERHSTSLLFDFTITRHKEHKKYSLSHTPRRSLIHSIVFTFHANFSNEIY